jgi:hypothetical protein
MLGKSRHEKPQLLAVNDAIADFQKTLCNDQNTTSKNNTT